MKLQDQYRRQQQDLAGGKVAHGTQGDSVAKPAEDTRSSLGPASGLLLKEAA